jgi:Rieske Fe-S protein
MRTLSQTSYAAVMRGSGYVLARASFCRSQAPETSSFYCPGHGAQFNLQGQWIRGQRTSNLRSYPVTYDASAAALMVGGCDGAR